MKRKAGKTKSGSVMPSAFDGSMCLSHAGMSATPARSLTNSINNTTSPRRMSIDSTRFVGFTGFAFLEYPASCQPTYNESL